MPSPSGIASSILPYIMAVLDIDGQAIGFSKSWYRLSGLDESESLGSGWLTIMHPDDVVEMTIAWIDAIRNHRSRWMYQARYRTASDGAYCWFLIRVQPTWMPLEMCFAGMHLWWISTNRSSRGSKRVDNNRYLLCSPKRMLCYRKSIKLIACTYPHVDRTGIRPGLWEF
jgi:PAS domain S-box-containing protein